MAFPKAENTAGLRAGHVISSRQEKYFQFIQRRAFPLCRPRAPVIQKMVISLESCNETFEKRLTQHLDFIKFTISTSAPMPVGTSKQIKKKIQDQKKRKAKAQALWLETKHVIGLVQDPDIQDATWGLIRDARTRLMFVGDTNPGDFYYAMTNWRLIEIQLIVWMIHKDWLKLVPVNLCNEALYVLACDTASSMRTHLAELFGDHIFATAPKATDPEGCCDQLPVELLMLTKLALSESNTATITVGLLETWYAHLSLVVMCITELSTAHRVEIVVPFHDRPGGNPRPMKTVPLLDFLSFHETENFPALLDEWTTRTADFHASQGRDFNYKQVCAYMEAKWDNGMLAYLEGDAIMHVNAK